MAGTQHALGTALVRSFFVLAFLAGLALTDCYLPDGNLNSGVSPCVIDASDNVVGFPDPFASKLCCREGHVCLLSGLCGQPNGQDLLYYRGGCSVNNWGDFDEHGSDCPNVCSSDKKDNLDNVSQAYPCPDDEAWWYCGSNPPDDVTHCKGAPHAYSIKGDTRCVDLVNIISAGIHSRLKLHDEQHVKHQVKLWPNFSNELHPKQHKREHHYLCPSPPNIPYCNSSTSTAPASPTNAPSSASPSTSTIVGVTVGAVSAVVIVALVLRSLLPMFGINSKSCCGMGRNRRGDLGRAESPPPLTDFGMKHQLEEFHGRDDGHVMQARRVELGDGRLARPEVVELPGNPQSFRRLPFDG
ncbi:hypothetical protein B0T22DRAFT_539867 [Podospora appendiculata]|uniref:Uncharacterized protein n=1 Tax=Podospora appendiculata TaxID=314037 RepID=A0AAE0X1V4_9PEZI|nr:hypothetical protein B0T22DRAFT_539867 [Podospora appendiculata]